MLKYFFFLIKIALRKETWKSDRVSAVMSACGGVLAGASKDTRSVRELSTGIHILIIPIYRQYWHFLITMHHFIGVKQLNPILCLSYEKMSNRLPFACGGLVVLIIFFPLRLNYILHNFFKSILSIINFDLLVGVDMCWNCATWIHARMSSSLWQQLW